MTSSPQSLIAEIIDWGKTIGGALVVYFTVTTVAFAQYNIPSESMVPTLEAGDRIIVSKFAYGYSRHSLPLNLGAALPASAQRLFARMPTRGDVIVFVHPRDGKVMVKRLIGLPGDEIAVRKGALWINGAPASLTEAQAAGRVTQDDAYEPASRREETLPGGVRHTIHLLVDGEGALNNFGPYRVPEGRLFFMGDNRDNSLDSRWAGMGAAPIENVVGRVETVIFAPRRCGAQQTGCRSRWLAPMHD